MTQDSIIPIIVTVDEDHLTTIEVVAEALESAGMKVEQILATVGIISGKASQSQISLLGQISGVLSVEPDQPMSAI